MDTHDEAYWSSTNVDLEELRKAHDLLIGGAKMKDVLTDLGLAYGPVWNYHYYRKHIEDGTNVPGFSELTPAKRKATVLKLRKAGDSWGHIMAKCNISEREARSLYESKTGEHSEGTRIGRGGRFLDGAEKLYRGEDRMQKGTSLSLEVPTKQAVADTEEV